MSSDLLSNVVSVEHVHPVRPSVVSASTRGAIPRVVASTLELSEERRISRSSLLEVSIVVEDCEVRGRRVGRTTLLKVATPARRVVIHCIKPGVTANVIDVVVHAPRLASKVGVIMYGRHVDTSVVCNSLEKLHVVNGSLVGGSLSGVGPLVTILILNLVENHVAAIDNRVLSNDTVDGLNVGLPGFSISRVVVAKRSVGTSCDPAWETTASTFCVNIGSRAVEYV